MKRLFDGFLIFLLSFCGQEGALGQLCRFTFRKRSMLALQAEFSGGVINLRKWPPSIGDDPDGLSPNGKAAAVGPTSAMICCTESTFKAPLAA
jgi:hypothetical protein